MQVAILYGIIYVMKCEICHKEEAKVAVRRVIDGRERELYVCPGCAASTDVPKSKVKKGGQIHLKIPGGQLPEAVIGAFLKHMVEATGLEPKVIENPTASIEPGKPCPLCGMRPEDYKRLGRLGCDACYEAFNRQLQPIIRDMHPGIAHAGKHPKRPATGDSANG